jgi:hypothetical protein
VRIALSEAPRAHDAEHGIVEATVGRDESCVSQEMTASREVKRKTVKVGDTPASFLDEQRTCGLIPNRFAIVGVCWDSHQQFGSTSREQHLLRLAVQEDGGRMTAKLAKYAVEFAKIAVT